MAWKVFAVRVARGQPPDTRGSVDLPQPWSCCTAYRSPSLCLFLSAAACMSQAQIRMFYFCFSSVSLCRYGLWHMMGPYCPLRKAHFTFICKCRWSTLPSSPDGCLSFFKYQFSLDFSFFPHLFQKVRLSLPLS